MLSRRAALLTASAFGLTLPKLLAADRPRKKACITLFLLGGPPQQETWDPKPESPLEARGDLKPTRSATPGLIVGEYMPRTARLTERIAVLRAVQTNDNAHSSSGYYMTTGVPHAPMGVENAKPGAPNDHPSLGAVVRRLTQAGNPVPAAVILPEQSANDGNLTWPGQDGGFLGRAADPWLLVGDPNDPAFRTPGLALPDEIPTDRFGHRLGLRERIDQMAADPALASHAARVRQAADLIAAPAARRAFDLTREPPAVRDRYGRTRFGQSCLLARRLVEAGVPFVRVNWTRLEDAPNNGHWDTHQKNSDGVKRLLPVLDQAYSALLEDLLDRGLFDDTLVVWTGEFGRTPKINPASGRDHWGHVFSVALAGGGVRGGAVHGRSDKLAAFPLDGRVTPQDLTATVLHALGMPADSEIHDGQGRPLPASRGEVLRVF